MSKLKKRSRYDGNFALLPDDVLTSDAGRTLPYAALAVQAALAAQFNSRNNGSLTLPRSRAAKYGVSSPYVFARSFRELEERGLSVCTRPGTERPPRAPMYALTWWPIDEPIRGDPHEARPTLTASHQWAKWKAERHEKRGRGGKVYSFTERYWSVPEPEMRKVRHRNLLQPRATEASSPGLHAKAEISSPGLPKEGSNPVAQGYTYEISGVGGTGNPKARGGEAGRRADVDVPGAQRGEQAQEVPAPAVPQSVAGELGADEVKELLDRARMSIEQRRVKFAAAIDPKPHLQDLFWYELGLLRARGTGYGPSWKFLAIRVEWHGWDQVRQAGLKGKAMGLYGQDLDAFLRAYPFQPRKDAAGPPASDGAGEPATPEVVIQRIREKAAKAPRRRAWDDSKRHVETPYWAFAGALLAEGSGKDEKWICALLGRLVSKYGWYQHVDKAVRECEARLLWGAPAIEFVRNYPFDDDQHGERTDVAGGQEREDAPMITGP